MKRLLYLLLATAMSATAVTAEEIIVATSDYESANTAVYRPGTGDFIPAALGQADQDIVVDTDGEYAYFISRTLGAVAKYRPGEIGTTIPGGGLVWEYSVGPGTNPYDLVFVGDKAYVVRYNAGEILIVDPDAVSPENFELGAIDITAYDSDSPDAVHGFAYGGMVYVVLQRLDGYTATVPGYLLKIDPATDTIVDLDPAEDGVQGMELLVKNPQSFGRIGPIAYIQGHAWGAQTEGVQTVDLGDPGLRQEMVLDEGELGMDITGMEVFDTSHAVIYSAAWGQDGMVSSVRWFDPVTGATGETLPVPTPDGGAVMVAGTAYVASRDDTAPGVYPVDPLTNGIAGDVLSTPLPPLSMVYIGSDPSEVAGEDAVPKTFILDAPRPNPFNPAVTVPFTLTSPGETAVEVFNIAGQQVATLLDGYLAAGKHAATWRAHGMANGVYCILVRHAGTAKTAKVLLAK